MRFTLRHLSEGLKSLLSMAKCVISAVGVLALNFLKSIQSRCHFVVTALHVDCMHKKILLKYLKWNYMILDYFSLLQTNSFLGMFYVLSVKNTIMTRIVCRYRSVLFSQETEVQSTLSGNIQRGQNNWQCSIIFWIFYKKSDKLIESKCLIRKSQAQITDVLITK